jgi:DNA-binding NarL/FixJ family response regulator
MIRIVLIDDHALVRTGFREILRKHKDIQVIGEAEDGESGFALIRKLEPDIALVDVHMPSVSGIEVTERVRKYKLATRVVIVTVAEDAPFPRRLLEAGASGYLTKACPSDELLRAIREVARGQRYIAAEVAQRLALEQLSNRDGASPFDALSARELEVAMMLANGRDLPYIAQLLRLSPKTIATYKYRLYQKLNVNNPVTLAHLAGIHGVSSPRQKAKP